MSLSHLDLAFVLKEVRGTLEGAVIQDVWQAGSPPRRRHVVLRLRRRSGRPLHLLVVAEGATSRLHVVEEPPARPADPGPFGGAVTRRLRGARIERIEQRRDDRIITLHTPVGRLVAELTGRTSNLILVGDDGKVVEAMTRNQPRGIWPGKPYVPPRPVPPGATAVTHDFSPVADAVFPLNRAVECFYRGLERADAWISRRKDLVARIADRVGRLEGRLRRLEEARVRTDPAEEARMRRQAETLLAHVGEVPRGAADAALPDPYDPGGAIVRIALDPQVDAQANVERLFVQARKAARGAARVAGEMQDTVAALEVMRDLLVRAEAARDPGEVEALDAEAFPRASEHTPDEVLREAPGRGGPRRHLSADRLEILVGRDASENDRLTFKIAKGHDVFVHVRGRPGAHVIVRLPRGKTAPLETLLDAAVLAVHYSSVPGDGPVEVDYAPRNDVRKPRKAPPGLVELQRCRTLRIGAEPERLRRLLASVPEGRPVRPAGSTSAGAPAETPSGGEDDLNRARFSPVRKRKPPEWEAP